MSMQPLKVLVWNVRGLNSRAWRRAVFQTILAGNPSLVCLQDTKMEVIEPDIVSDCTGNKFWDFYYLPASGTRGGILIAWDPLVLTLSHPTPLITC